MAHCFTSLIIAICIIWNISIRSASCNLAVMDHISRWHDGHSKLSVYCRPTSNNPDNKTEIVYKTTLVQLVNLDVKAQVLTGRFWENIQWTDLRLAWDPAEYNDTMSVNIPTESNAIWIPDIVLYNQYDTERLAMYHARVYHNGTVIWIPSTVYHVACSMDITYFPWDIHTCELTFGSWSLTDDELVFKVQEDKDVNPSHIISSSEWLIETSVPVAASTSFGVMGNWTLITYTLTFHRRVAFFTYVVSVPPVVMSFLTILVFCLPPDMVDKINIALTIFLSYFVLLMIVVEATPRSGFAIPLLGQYLLVCMSLLAASIFACALVYNLATKTTRRKFSQRTMERLRLLAKCMGMTSLARRETDIAIENNMGNSALPLKNQMEIRDESADQWHLLSLVVQRAFFIIYMIVNVTVLLLLLIRVIARHHLDIGDN